MRHVLQCWQGGVVRISLDAVRSKGYERTGCKQHLQTVTVSFPCVRTQAVCLAAHSPSCFILTCSHSSTPAYTGCAKQGGMSSCTEAVCQTLQWQDPP